MTVPSYDDLTPGIPGVIDAEAAGNLASILRALPAAGPQRPASGAERPADGSQRLYACVRLAAGSGKPDAALSVARDFSPRVKQVSDREVVLDASGLGRLIGPPAEIERQLAHALLDARVVAAVAIAPTQTIARLLAHAAETGHGACGRGPWPQLPVEWLGELEVLPPGIQHRDRARPYETLSRWGIATVGELAALPAADVASRLARRGAALQRLARGRDPVPFVPDGVAPRYVGRLELEWPIDALEPLSFVLARLLDPLSASLERADRAAAAIHVELRLTDRSVCTRLLPLPAPLRDARVLRTLVLLDLESHPPAPLGGFGQTSPATAAIDVVTIEVDPAPSRIVQFSLLQRALPSVETLSTLTARLAALVGDARVGAPALVDSHAPDAFAMERYAPADAKSADGAGANGADSAGANGAKGAKGANGAGANGANGADGAGANGAGADGAVIRRLRPPLTIRVSVDRGRPTHIAASRRGIPYGAIVQAAGPWRSSGEWWGERAWNRNEWDIALKSGAVCRIVQSRTTGCWFLEGLYD